MKKVSIGLILTLAIVSVNAQSNAQAETYYYGNQHIKSGYYKGRYRLKETSGQPIQTLNMLSRTDTSRAVDFIDDDNDWESACSVMQTLVIRSVSNKWIDQSEDRAGSGRPDIFIEIRDANNNLVFGVDDGYWPNASFPLTINLRSMPLLRGSTYTLKIYDKDQQTSNDLLGTFNFRFPFTILRFSKDGTVCTLRADESNSPALDAHWSMEKVYDYYLTKHNRHSFDDKDGAITCYIHPDSSVVGYHGNNVIWNHGAMIFGDGDLVKRSSFTALDICGHEFTHGVIANNGRGGLDLQRESGALNESFADIFGTVIELSSGISGNWTYGEKTYIDGGFTRSLKNPKLRRQPDTYGGRYWINPDSGTLGIDNDFGGIHTNSGVQNQWFYLLAEGGNSVNDLGDHYSVPAIGIDKAASIAYTNMMSLLPKSATYSDAYLQSLKAARMNGFADTSMEYRSVREAWFAVGVAKRPVIDSFAPSGGGAGTTVTIRGSNFTGLSYVGFNGLYVPASRFTVNQDATEITITVPEGVTEGPLSIISGYDTIKTANIFTGCAIVVDLSVLTFARGDPGLLILKINTTGGTPPYQYTVSGYKNVPPFDTLMELGTYDRLSLLSWDTKFIVYAKDAMGCTGKVDFRIQGNSGQSTGETIIFGVVQCIQSGTGIMHYDMGAGVNEVEITQYGGASRIVQDTLTGSGDITFQYVNPGLSLSFLAVKVRTLGTDKSWYYYLPCPGQYLMSNTNTSRKPVEIAPVQAPAIYPNPAYDFATLYIPDAKAKTQVVLSDMAGKLLWQTTYSGKGTITIPVKNLLSGTYIVTLNAIGKPKLSLQLIKVK